MEASTHHSAKRTPFSLPVDSDHKATAFRPLSFAPPHMRAFHLAWLSLFSCFFSTFSIPPLLALIRTDLHLSDSDVSTANIASFVGSILSRLTMGPICDIAGPRVASATLSLLTAPAVLCMSFVASPLSFIILRFLIGFSLANFVANQFWMSSMFSPNIVGLANGVASGWANAGAGAAQLMMPIIYSVLLNFSLIPPSNAWRSSFFIPALFQAGMAIAVLAIGQDLPDGNYKRSQKKKESTLGVLLQGMKNYRGWVLGLSYGFSFGVELTTDNIIAEYFYERFGLNLEMAGVGAACFGVANLVTRPMGGVVSDRMGRRYGMRGRLWSLWGVQTVAGLLCVLLGRVNSLWGSIAVMCCFSVFVQAAGGLTFGVVPFVSKRSLGVISGMTGSGGTMGAVITQFLLFSGSRYSTQTGISLMGLMMIVCTLSLTTMYFPQSGGMFCGPSWDSNTIREEDYHLLG
ncbi:high affinity nitrate transporter 2.7 [Malania oleifera]|uniref:high affinity nitrate transporter 2.7 n=1 Tax=Malania oleifera TaxID=397392 RepID=UPI0025AE527D|nr:high affinity nitrate transporter 2.7 [Malania oleifera]